MEQCRERGASETEVCDAIRNGQRAPANHGRELYRLDFAFDGYWQGKYFATRQVAPVIKEETDEIVVITVYTFYF